MIWSQDEMKLFVFIVVACLAFVIAAVYNSSLTRKNNRRKHWFIVILFISYSVFFFHSSKAKAINYAINVSFPSRSDQKLLLIFLKWNENENEVAVCSNERLLSEMQTIQFVGILNSKTKSERWAGRTHEISIFSSYLFSRFFYCGSSFNCFRSASNPIMFKQNTRKTKEKHEKEEYYIIGWYYS